MLRLDLIQPCNYCNPTMLLLVCLALCNILFEGLVLPFIHSWDSGSRQLLYSGDFNILVFLFVFFSFFLLGFSYTCHVAFLYFQLCIIFISYKLLLLITIITVIIIMVITNNFMISTSIIIVFITTHTSSTFIIFVIHSLIFVIIIFIILTSTLTFIISYFISFLSQFILIMAIFYFLIYLFIYLFRLISRRAKKSQDQVQRSHYSIPLVFKFYVLILIYFRVTFMEIFLTIFIWVWFLKLFNISIILLNLYAVKCLHHAYETAYFFNSL